MFNLSGSAHTVTLKWVPLSDGERLLNCEEWLVEDWRLVQTNAGAEDVVEPDDYSSES
jgi:hypothetical protein